MLRSILFVVLAAGALRAQEPEPPAAAVLKYTGSPLRVPVTCSEEDLRALRLTCPSSRPCPVYLELTGIESAGSKLFVTGNLHAEDTTLFSILLASDDGGSIWREPYERVRGAGLDLIQFLDFDTGWVSGEALGSIPRDPFLLRTQDGGKIWKSYPVFSEGRAGTIDYFHFDSKTQGRLWIDRPLSGESGARHETYESQDGGETWILRESSDKPSPQSARPAHAADYRLRADRATGAYRVERHAPARWETVASFLIRAGECSEPEFAPPQEPEPPETGDTRLPSRPAGPPRNASMSPVSVYGVDR